MQGLPPFFDEREIDAKEQLPMDDAFFGISGDKNKHN